MKKLALLLAVSAVATTNYRCKSPSTPTTDSTGSFSYTIEADTSFTNLPALQSFVFGEAGGNWLMLGGRTNGFHGFSNPDQNFPHKKANKYIYAYNPSTHVLDSMSTDVLWADLRDQFTATNMAYRQVDSFLYICGGYGVAASQPDSPYMTMPIMSRVHVPKMIAAVQNHDSIALRKSIAYFENGLVASTGGELFRIDSNFYLCVGHNFTGTYSDTTSATTQVYLDQVRVFKLQETDSTITMIMPIQTISDGLPDSTTQFRRRDLVVAPNMGIYGSSYGISIYGGVFTYTPGCPSCNGGNPFRNPIYITPNGGTNPSYTLDTSYTQASNIYSAPNLQMFDSLNNTMFTTIFGGLGDTLYPGKTDTTAGDNASFTKLVLTVAHNNSNNTTTSIYNASGLPAYVGSEGAFIRAAGMPLYNNNKLGIINYRAIPTGSPQVIGYIYGGILSNGTQWNPPGNPTQPSNTVYKVSITRN